MRTRILMVIVACVVGTGGLTSMLLASPRPRQTGAGATRRSPAETVSSVIEVTAERQSIVRVGPHLFREVQFKLLNNATKPVHVFGVKREDRFDPAGGVVTGPSGAAAPRPEDVQHTQSLLPGKALMFSRSYSPAQAGKTMKAAVYCAFNKNGPPAIVTTGDFRLE